MYLFSLLYLCLGSIVFSMVLTAIFSAKDANTRNQPWLSATVTAVAGYLASLLLFPISTVGNIYLIACVLTCGFIGHWLYCKLTKS